MDFEEDEYDYHPIEPIDISFDEESSESDLLKEILDEEKEHFLKKVQYIMTDK